MPNCIASASIRRPMLQFAMCALVFVILLPFLDPFRDRVCDAVANNSSADAGKADAAKGVSASDKQQARKGREKPCKGRKQFVSVHVASFPLDARQGDPGGLFAVIEAGKDLRRSQ